MPRYFFTIDGVRRNDDYEGTVLQDADTARLEAISLAGSWIADRPYLLTAYRDLRVEVHDKEGNFIFLVTIFVSNNPGSRPGRF